MEERGHILNVLKKVKSALKTGDYIEIKNLSNQVIHSASINQDADSVSLAVIIYALSKIIEREKYKSYTNWKRFFKAYVSCINNAIKALKKNDIPLFREQIILIRRLIQNLSGNLKNYIGEVFRKAEINKASRIYEHGISIENTAKILGVSVWDLAEYTGKTGISDVDLSVTMPVKERIKQAEEIFEE